MGPSYYDRAHHYKLGLGRPTPVLIARRPSAKLADMTSEQMKNRLLETYPNAVIEVYDTTGTQDHWDVVVESPVFAGMSRIQQHQHVMACFGPELKTGEVHALSIKTKIK